MPFGFACSSSLFHSLASSTPLPPFLLVLHRNFFFWQSKLLLHLFHLGPVSQTTRVESLAVKEASIALQGIHLVYPTPICLLESMLMNEIRYHTIPPESGKEAPCLTILKTCDLLNLEEWWHSCMKGSLSCSSNASWSPRNWAAYLASFLLSKNTIATNP